MRYNDLTLIQKAHWWEQHLHLLPLSKKGKQTILEMLKIRDDKGVLKSEVEHLEEWRKTWRTHGGKK